MTGTASDDWTADENGISNSSPEYLRMVSTVNDLLGEGAGWALDPTWRSMKAGLIVSQLAHVHGLAPLSREGT